MRQKISEMIPASIAISPQDVATSDVTSSYVSVANYHGPIRALAAINAVADGKKLTVTLLQAKTSGGGSAKTLGTAVEVTAVAPSSSEDLFAAVEAAIEDMDTDFKYIAVKLGTDATSSNIGCAVLEIANPRFFPVA